MNNFTVRTISSVVFAAVIVAALLYRPYLYGAVFLLVMIVAMQEFFRMSLGTRFLLQQKLALASATLAFCFVLFHCWFGTPFGFLALALIPLIAIPMTSLSHNSAAEDYGLVSYVFAALVYVALPFVLNPLLMFKDGGFNGWMMLSFFIIIWAADVGAYCIGSWLGQKPGARRLAPSISPKKSWWGFWGGLVLGTASAAILNLAGWLSLPLLHCLALGALISCAGVLGDLCESKWKRFFNVKDSGNCIPGHGGMLDRFDSSMIAVPVALIYLSLFNLI